MCLLCNIRHDFPVTLHTPGAYGQWSVSDHNGAGRQGSTGQDMGLGDLGMANSKLGNYNLLHSGWVLSYLVWSQC